MKSLLLAAAALCGFSAQPQIVNVGEIRPPVVAIKNGEEKRTLKADVFDSFASSLLGHSRSFGGTPPDVWGRSRACFRMVRKNKKIARK